MKFIKKAAALLLAFLMLLVPATALADETNVTDTTTAESFVCYGDDLNSEQFEKVMNLLGADLSKDQLIKVTIDDEKALLGSIIRRTRSARVRFPPRASRSQARHRHLRHHTEHQLGHILDVFLRVWPRRAWTTRASWSPPRSKSPAQRRWQVS